MHHSFVSDSPSSPLLRVVDPSRYSGKLDETSVVNTLKIPDYSLASNWLGAGQYEFNTIPVHISFRREPIARRNQSSYKRQLIPVLRQDINYFNDNCNYV